MWNGVACEVALSKPVAKDKSLEIDLRPYAGRWVALIRGQIAGVGLTPEEALIASKLSRPKEEPSLHFVPVERRMGKQTDGKRTAGKRLDRKQADGKQGDREP